MHRGRRTEKPAQFMSIPPLNATRPRALSSARSTLLESKDREHLQQLRRAEIELSYTETPPGLPAVMSTASVKTQLETNALQNIDIPEVEESSTPPCDEKSDSLSRSPSPAQTPVKFASASSPPELSREGSLKALDDFSSANDSSGTYRKLFVSKLFLHRTESLQPETHDLIKTLTVLSQHSPAGEMIIDLDSFKILYANPAFLTFLNEKNLHSLQRRGIQSLFGPNVSTFISQELNRLACIDDAESPLEKPNQLYLYDSVNNTFSSFGQVTILKFSNHKRIGYFHFSKPFAIPKLSIFTAEINMINYGLIKVDPLTSHIIDANQYVCVLFNIPRARFQEMTIDELMPPAFRSTHARIFNYYSQRLIESKFTLEPDVKIKKGRRVTAIRSVAEELSGRATEEFEIHLTVNKIDDYLFAEVRALEHTMSPEEINQERLKKIFPSNLNPNPLTLGYEKALKNHWIKKYHILLIDVHQSTEKANIRETQQNGLFAISLTEVISNQMHAHGGFLVKTMGDGAWTIFENGLEAIQYALKFQEKMKEIRQRQRSKEFSVRIAIHYDNVFLSCFHREPGCEKVDIYGSGCNYVARLESRCPLNGLNISKESIEQLPDRFIGIIKAHLQESDYHPRQDSIAPLKGFPSATKERSLLSYTGDPDGGFNSSKLLSEIQLTLKSEEDTDLYLQTPLIQELERTNRRFS